MLKQRLFQYQGHIEAALILGGYDTTGPSLYTIYPHGSTDNLPFVTMGSGSLAAMGILEAHYQPDMDRETAMNLVKDAICSGIFNDLGSGSNCDLTVIEKGKTEVYRGYLKPNERKHELRIKPFPIGTTPVTKTQVISLSDFDVVDVEAMEIS